MENSFFDVTNRLYVNEKLTDDTNFIFFWKSDENKNTFLCLKTCNKTKIYLTMETFKVTNWITNIINFIAGTIQIKFEVKYKTKTNYQIRFNWKNYKPILSKNNQYYQLYCRYDSNQMTRSQPQQQIKPSHNGAF